MSDRPQYDEWEFEEQHRHDVEWLGTTATTGTEGAPGMPVFLDRERNEVFRAETDVERQLLSEVTESTRSTAESSVTEVIQNIGDELGWERLSEFGEENS
ncbi:hypothetical protein [Salarchaeum japonicum]|uniref:hypothetical protein n=1 Tax=Salarchaeum japonicum TaxID=555573 RepID=UPI003C741E57